MEDKDGNTINKMCTPKAIIALIIFGILAVASIVVIVILVKKKDNFYDSYYISDIIEEKEEGTNKILKYRKVDVNKEHYIGKLNENVTRIHVRYYNRYGIKLAGDLYQPKQLDINTKYMAVVIGPPYGGVKEQGPSIYANELASRGFVALAFDPSFNGESGGRSRHASSSDIFMEDFSAGVDYLGTLSYVDREKIGGIGICGSGGFLLGAATIDIRIKAVVTVVMYDIPEITYEINNSNEALKNLKDQRWADVDKGEQNYSIIYEPDREYINGSFPSFPPDYELWRIFYSTERGHHPRSIGGFTDTSVFSLANLQITKNIDKISPRPILFIYGENAHSKDYTLTAYNNVKNNDKVLYEVKSANHIDLYDKVNMETFDIIDNFLKQNLTKTI